MTGIHSLSLAETPVAILDFETTGLSPRTGARVVEVAVVRIEPGAEPRLVLDTLVDPQATVQCSSIHGIYDHDVLGAPTFAELAGPIVHALEGAVVAIFNASFDTQFLEAETKRSRRLQSFVTPPHVCMMYLRPALGLGDRVSLESALRAEGLPVPDHRAAHDALATAMLWSRYRDHARQAGYSTFGSIAERKRYKFMQSWARNPFDRASADSVGPAETRTALMPRMTPLDYPPALASPTAPVTPAASESSRPPAARSAYLHALIDAFQDGKLDATEIEDLLDVQRTSNITRGEVRAIHAAFYAEVLKVCVEDDFVSHQEAANLLAIGDALRELGWAPGDAT